MRDQYKHKHNPQMLALVISESRIESQSKSPLKSAMRVPGTPARKIENPLSPTFREEDILEKREKMTEAEQAKDLVRIDLYSIHQQSGTDK